MRRSGVANRISILLLSLSVAVTTTGSGVAFGNWQVNIGSSHDRRTSEYPLPSATLADFDGDLLPDAAEVFSIGFDKKIELTLSSLTKQDLYFSHETPESGSILAEDVDSDSDNDLIWISNLLPTHTALWINNGTAGFTRAREHSAFDALISRFIPGNRGDGRYLSIIAERLIAIRSFVFTPLSRTDNCLPSDIYSHRDPLITPDQTEYISPCLASHFDRGPPSFQS